MRLFANSAYNFGIQGVNSDESLTLSNVELTAVDLAYHLTDDEDGNGVPDYLDFVSGGSIVEPTPTPTPTEIPTTTPTEEPTVTPTTEPSQTETPTPTEEPTPTPIIDYDLDRDLDGLPDYIEEQIGTDPLKADTDEDGLEDYPEILMGYDPVNPDSDNNGITDGNEDFDNDGLSNIHELQIGTELCFEDSDGDNLIDGDEIYIYGTDPLVHDSDGDGINDGDEVAIGKNPSDISDGATRIPQTFTQTINNPEDASITSVDVSISVANKIDRVVDVDDYYNVDVYSTGVYGRIGSPLNFECDEDFDTATVVIHYDESSLGEASEENLGVLWYDEETGFYIVQEQAVIDTTNNTVTLVLDHFSTYVLVDLNKWNNPQITSVELASGSIRTVTYNTSGVYYTGFEESIDPERYETQAWNLYCSSQGGIHQNETRLETVEMSHYFLFGSLYYSYTWNVSTNDYEDNDHDGVPDALEINGINPLNGSDESYRSLIGINDDCDSDNDGLSDLDEYGTIYFISKDSDDGSITIIKIDSSGQNIWEDDSLVYLKTRNYANMILDFGQSVAFCDPFSDPMETDTDEDGRTDDIDPNPMKYYVLVDYNRQEALDYAERWYQTDLITVHDITIHRYNPMYHFYSDGDCANFVSQCLRAGGFIETRKWHSDWFGYDRSDSWSIVYDQYEYFSESDYCSELFSFDGTSIGNGDLAEIISEHNIQPGDILYMDWDADGCPNHATMVCSVTTDNITYTGHTNPQWDQDIIYAYNASPSVVFTVIHLGG